jgi:hypothetical protein
VGPDLQPSPAIVAAIVAAIQMKTHQYQSYQGLPGCEGMADFKKIMV